MCLDHRDVYATVVSLDCHAQQSKSKDELEGEAGSGAKATMPSPISVEAAAGLLLPPFSVPATPTPA
eukprot:364897-Chlamydomonas_euryale.AAC.2